MGFFSRMFQPGDAVPSSEDWASQPEDDQTSQEDVVLFEAGTDEAATRLDIDAAIIDHERWVSWLGEVLQGARDERLRPEVVADEACCEMGQWLQGSGQVALGRFPAFGMLVRNHRYFHQQAGELIAHAEAGESQQAEQNFKTCRHASRQMILLLKELQRAQAARAARHH